MFYEARKGAREAAKVKTQAGRLGGPPTVAMASPARSASLRRMKQLLIVWHSRTGAARAMAEAAVRGAAGEPEVTPRLAPAELVQAGDLLSADGYLFACPENLAAMSGAMKEFFDRNYYAVLDQLNGRPYAAMIAAGSDGTGAARQMARICTGWRLRAIAEPLIVGTHAQTAEAILAPKTLGAADLKACADLGAGLALGMAMGVF